MCAHYFSLSHEVKLLVGQWFMKNTTDAIIIYRKRYRKEFHITIVTNGNYHFGTLYPDFSRK